MASTLRERETLLRPSGAWWSPRAGSLIAGDLRGEGGARTESILSAPRRFPTFAERTAPRDSCALNPVRHHMTSGADVRRVRQKFSGGDPVGFGLLDDVPHRPLGRCGRGGALRALRERSRVTKIAALARTARRQDRVHTGPVIAGTIARPTPSTGRAVTPVKARRVSKAVPRPRLRYRVGCDVDLARADCRDTGEHARRRHAPRHRDDGEKVSDG